MQFARLVLREQDLRCGMTEQLASASNVFADWLQFAIDLLVGHQLQLNAAHNKVKHGLSVRARDDLKVSFVTTPPNADGTISVGALTGPDAVDIFDRPVIEVLAQAPKMDGHRQGLELTQLRVDVPAVLAEAYMIAWAHGAMFHVAATKHFECREDLPDYLHAPSHPGYPVGGPHPDHVSGKALVGMRFPLTTPEAPWVPFRVSARRIGACPRSSIQGCVTASCAWSKTAKPARVVPAQHRSVRSPLSSGSARRRYGSGATVTSPPSRLARESRSRRRTASFGGNSTTPRRNDHVHRHAPREVRSRGDLPHPRSDRMWVHHLPRIPRRQDQANLRSKHAG